jgi:uncharacterized membrane protein
MSKTKTILLWVMAAAYILAGFNHLVNPAFYVNIMPPALPDPERLNVLSGLVEIVLGVYLLEPRTRVYAAWGIIALLIAVFPANLHVAIHDVDPSTGEFGAGAGAAGWIRLPFQGLFILWAWWYTRPDAD